MQLLQQRLFSMKLFGKDPSYNLPEILYSDQHVLVAFKPAGWVVPIETQHAQSLERYIKEMLQKKLGRDNIFLRPIHRLDKPVRGLVLFARSSKGLSRLNKALREKQVEKFYLAKVSKTPEKKMGMLTHNLVHGDYQAELVEEGGKEAKLIYRVIDQGEESLLSVKLLTGRYHQIRAQLSAIGHPILGDKKYKCKGPYSSKKIALYHTKVVFPHPTLKRKCVVALRPDDL